MFEKNEIGILELGDLKKNLRAETLHNNKHQNLYSGPKYVNVKLRE
jgi:hypothetical protein